MKCERRCGALLPSYAHKNPPLCSMGRHDVNVKPVGAYYVKFSIKRKVAKMTDILFVHISMVISTEHQDNYLKAEKAHVVFGIVPIRLVSFWIFVFFCIDKHFGHVETQLIVK